MSKLMKDISHHSMRFDLREIPEARENRMFETAMRIMDDRLSSSAYLAGTEMASLADIACFEEIEQLEMLPMGGPPPEGRELSSYPHVLRWIQVMQSLPGYAEVHKGLHGACKALDKRRAKATKVPTAKL